ncbi:pep-cterm sorting domain-containing protein [Anaeramoeba ignava]|uniref:Pep-cterm sorting domain-containing protein n=1 Tax=Anaeramoeba ignava TaxID=1746090 RepID=A0A9Q0LQA8_ANAIG|nr:pep-cterm sorting domain-containing protein [Anaeramoeba ignava]
MENYSDLEKLSNDLKNLFQNQNEKEEESYFDFEIICEQNKTSFKTHKSILSSRRKIEINLENAIQILIFSSKYLIDELIEICLNFIKKNLQFETIVDVLKLSETMSLNQLLESCYQFIFGNFDKFIKTSFFLELEENHLNSILSNDELTINEFELFQSIIKWGKHKSNINQEKELEKEEKEEKEKLQNQISNIIEKIRFIDFTKQELKDTLKEDLIPNEMFIKLTHFLLSQKNEKVFKELIEKENSFIFKSRFKLDSTIIQDFKYVKKVQGWINDNDFFSKMKKGFSAKRDGFDSKTWHKAVDDKEKTLVIIKTKDNFIFGGFTQVGFTNDKSKWIKVHSPKEGGDINDPNAFIFSLRNSQGDRKPHKFPIQQGKEHLAIHSYINYGPLFGSGHPDFYLKYDLRGGHSNIGWVYNPPDGITFGTDSGKSYLAGSHNSWVVDEVETYFI